MGLLYGRNLPFTTDNDGIRVFRHALSLDEVRIHRCSGNPEYSMFALQHRAKFQPNMFHRTSPDEESAEKDPEHASRANTAILEHHLEEPHVQKPRPKLTMWKMTVRRLSEIELYRSVARENDSSVERSDLRKTEPGLLQSVEEVWFAGCHADVGGLYPKPYMSCCPSF